MRLRLNSDVSSCPTFWHSTANISNKTFFGLEFIVAVFRVSKCKIKRYIYVRFVGLIRNNAPFTTCG